MGVKRAKKARKQGLYVEKGSTYFSSLLNDTTTQKKIEEWCSSGQIPRTVPKGGKEKRGQPEQTARRCKMYAAPNKTHIVVGGKARISLLNQELQTLFTGFVKETKRHRQENTRKTRQQSAALKVF